MDPALSPRVTVLLPVYNGGRYLGAAIDSILAQTLRDFELLVIDDGSSDDSAAVIATFGDARIRSLRNPSNRGLVGTLNRGLDEARGQFVARMDQDDLSLPTRLAEQVRFLERHPEIGICGTAYRPFGPDEVAGLRVHCPSGRARIDAALLFNSPLGHPTVMMRRAALERHGLRYRPEAEYAEDYDLWARAADLFALDNLRVPLLRYRVHAGQMSQSRRQLAAAGQVRRAQLAKLGVAASARELALNDYLCGGERAPLDGTPEPELAREAVDWLLRLDAANRQRRRYRRLALATALCERWAALSWLRLTPRRWTGWKSAESARLLSGLLLASDDRP